MTSDPAETMHPYFRAAIEAMAAARRPNFHQLTPEEARATLRASQRAAPPPEGLAPLAEVADEAIASATGPIPVRRYLPTGDVKGTGVYLHAGGWVIGDLDFSDTTCRRLATASGCEIVSVDYRLAPEHVFPAALDDAYAALVWAAREREGPIALIGESAGGNLAAACAIRARDTDGPAVAALILAYPVTDHDLASLSYRELGERSWLVSTADMRWFWDHYCPPGIDRNDPLVSPLRVSDAAGLPPTFICLAELDPLREEGVAFARRLLAAGVDAEWRCDPGMLHGYLGAAASVPLAAEALAEAAAFLKARLA